MIEVYSSARLCCCTAAIKTSETEVDLVNVDRDEEAEGRAAKVKADCIGNELFEGEQGYVKGEPGTTAVDQSGRNIDIPQERRRSLGLGQFTAVAASTLR